MTELKNERENGREINPDEELVEIDDGE